MPTSNEIMLDLAITHAIGLRRLSDGTSERVVASLSALDRELIHAIRDSFELIGVGGIRVRQAQIRRLDRLIIKVREMRSQSVVAGMRTLRDELRDLVDTELAFQSGAIQVAVSIGSFVPKVPSTTAAYSTANALPFNGRTLSEWVSGFRMTDTQRLIAEIKAGFSSGASPDDIVRQIKSASTVSYRQVWMIVRTASTHFATSARDSLFAENADIIMAERWTSVLDGQTSLICAGRDGHIGAVPGGEISPELSHMPRLSPPDARPPAHLSCRSIMVAILFPDGIVGERPFVIDTRGGRERTIDFAAESRESGESVASVRKRWAESRVGRVPANTTYDQWLRRQSRSFQSEILGPTRASLFRDGGLKLDSFTDYRGRRYTVGELRSMDAEAFKRAGIK